MRFEALHTFTSKLPLINPDPGFDKIIGTDTGESILAGVQTAVIAEVTEMINRYEQNYQGLKVVLCGGDSAFFEKHLKNRIFVDPFLMLKGLNFILNYA